MNPASLRCTTGENCPHCEELGLKPPMLGIESLPLEAEILDAALSLYRASEKSKDSEISRLKLLIVALEHERQLDAERKRNAT